MNICDGYYHGTIDAKLLMNYLNYFKNEDVLLGTLETVAHNFHVKGKKRNRFEDPVKRFYEGLMIIGDPKVLSYVSINLNGPQKDSVYRWRKKNSRLLVELTSPTSIMY